MEANTYQELAMRTANSNPLASTAENRLINAALGLCGEAGEIADSIKKFQFHGHDLVRPVRDEHDSALDLERFALVFEDVRPLRR